MVLDAIGEVYPAVLVLNIFSGNVFTINTLNTLRAVVMSK